MDLKEIMVGANKYIRGQGAIAQVGDCARQLGKSALIIGGKNALSAAGKLIVESLQSKGIKYKIETFTTEVSENQMKSFAAGINDGDFIIGVGGGKAIDVSKWVAEFCDLPYIAIPTSAATCASVVSLFVCYEDDGKPRGGLYRKQSPEFCIVDSKIIAEAPKRLLVSGIGDTLSKWPETKYAARNLEVNVFIQATEELGKLAFDLCLEKGIAAVRAVEAKQVTKELEEIIDINLLISGLTGNMAGDECRLALSHCVHDGLVSLGWAKKFLHGEKVAYGTLVQLALLDGINNDFLTKIIKFYLNIGLPTCLADLGIPEDKKYVDDLAKASYRDRLQFGPVATPFENVVAGMLLINSLAHNQKRD